MGDNGSLELQLEVTHLSLKWMTKFNKLTPSHHLIGERERELSKTSTYYIDLSIFFFSKSLGGQGEIFWTPTPPLALLDSSLNTLINHY
jgi:hypothetical protein